MRLLMTWRVAQDIPRLVIEYPSFNSGVLRFSIESDGGKRSYQETPRSPSPDMVVGNPAPAGFREEQLFVLMRGSFVGETGPGAVGVPFPVPGQYRLRAIHDDQHNNLHAESNWISIRVVAPEGPDAQFLGELQRGAHAAGVWRRYPDSPYAHVPRLMALRAAMDAINAGKDPETGERMGSGEAIRSWQQAEWKRLAVETISRQWGQFEQDALRLALSCAGRARDEGLSEAVKRRLNEEFPGWEDAPDLRLY